MAHALVVGGTGMLKEVTLYLLQRFDTVSVIARSPNGFKKLEQESGKLSSHLNKLQLDYTHYNDLTSLLIKAIKDFGEINLAVSWIHSSAPLAPLLIAKVINDTSQHFDFYEILGSSHIHPENEKREEKFTDFENIKYHKIILGFVIEAKSSRWLTNEEISRGVIEAIEKGDEDYVIGTVEPWMARP